MNAWTRIVNRWTERTCSFTINTITITNLNEIKNVCCWIISDWSDKIWHGPLGSFYENSSLIVMQREEENISLPKLRHNNYISILVDNKLVKIEITNRTKARNRVRAIKYLERSTIANDHLLVPWQNWITIVANLRNCIVEIASTHGGAITDICLRCRCSKTCPQQQAQPQNKLCLGHLYFFLQSSHK